MYRIKKRKKAMAVRALSKEEETLVRHAVDHFLALQNLPRAVCTAE
jgi:hypothetical protein